MFTDLRSPCFFVFYHRRNNPANVNQFSILAYHARMPRRQISNSLYWLSVKPHYGTGAQNLTIQENYVYIGSGT